MIELVLNFLRFLLFDEGLFYFYRKGLFLLLFNKVFRVRSIVRFLLDLFWGIPQPLLKVRPSFLIFFDDEPGCGGIHMKFSPCLGKALALIDDQTNEGLSFLYSKGVTFVEIWAYLRFCRE